jgi:hypothetical protein
MINSDTILDWLKAKVESKQPIPQEAWLDAGFKLNLLLADEHLELENLRAIVSGLKLKIYKDQDKKNVAACEMEVEASVEYRSLKLQEHRVGRIEEFIKLAKKNASQY